MNQSQTIRLGYVNDQYHDKLALVIQAQLQEVQSETELLAFEEEGGIALLQDALKKGYIDVAVCLLKDLPTSQPEGLCIAALSKREIANDWLLIPKDKAAQQGIFGLADHSSIATQHDHTKVQFLQLNPTFQVSTAHSLGSAIIGLKAGTLDALVFSGAELLWSGIELSDFKVIKLAAREIVPYPGQGIIAMLALTSDVPTRKLLQRIHRREVSNASNIERGAKRLLDEQHNVGLGVYCEMDYADNFHAWAVLINHQSDDVKKSSYSSSTSFGMAAEIGKLLKASAYQE